MLSGRRLDLLDPSPFDIEIEDIAHGLARVARWNGQTEGEYAFTVAQHSVEVEGLCHDLQPGWDPAWRLAALLHDAPEYVIGDLISPFKTAVGLDYKAFEARLESAIHVRFGLPASLPRDVKALIKRADTVAAYFEATQLAGFSIEEAQSFFGEPRGLTRTLVPLPAKEAHSAFLARFHALIAALDQSRSRAGEDLNGPTPDQARAWAKGTLL
ncbi:MAG: HD family hydrolase [Pseudomonadota bacterium]